MNAQEALWKHDAVREHFVIQTRICAWCLKIMGALLVARDEYTTENYESHGICVECNRREFGI